MTLGPIYHTITLEWQVTDSLDGAVVFIRARDTHALILAD